MGKKQATTPPHPYVKNASIPKRRKTGKIQMKSYNSFTGRGNESEKKTRRIRKKRKGRKTIVKMVNKTSRESFSQLTWSARTTDRPSSNPKPSPCLSVFGLLFLSLTLLSSRFPLSIMVAIRLLLLFLSSLLLLLRYCHYRKVNYHSLLYDPYYHHYSPPSSIHFIPSSSHLRSSCDLHVLHTYIH